MKKIFKYSAALLSTVILFAGCQKFTEPAPYQPAQMTPTMTLAEIKGLVRYYADTLQMGYPYLVTDNSIVLAGKVISSDESGNVYRSLYIEDGTAGLEVKIGKTGLYNDYKLGQTIYIKPGGLLWFGTYGESLQLGAESSDPRYETGYIDVQALINQTIFRGDFGEPVTPTDITSKSQINDAMVCRYVRLVNASYQGSPDGLKTWAVSSDPFTGSEAAYGQQTFTVDGTDVVVRTSGYASFADEPVNMELGQKCNLTGILTKFYDTFQLVLLDLDGVERL